MLEHYFRSYEAMDRIRAQWLGPQIERYVQSLWELHTSQCTTRHHVRVLGHFNTFVVARGVTRLETLPDYLDAFVDDWQTKHNGGCKSAQDRAALVTQSRLPVERMLCLALPGFVRANSAPPLPFATTVPGFFRFLRDEKGLRPTTLHGYIYTLRPFEVFLAHAGVALAALTPAGITEFVTGRAATLHRGGMHATAYALRVFLRYVHREGIVAKDLASSVPRGRVYRQANLPRAIRWGDVERLLASIDRRSDLGKRDYAILTLLASYGLRAREIAALRLDDIDWPHGQIDVPLRKGGHSTRYPLSTTVGEAVIAYLRVRRCDVTHRQVFLTTKTPYTPMQHWTVSAAVGGRLRRAGINVVRPGSHTLRHACVQRLVDADVAFKVIGDYVGHRDPASTLGYARVAVHKLRESVVAGGEDVL